MSQREPHAISPVALWLWVISIVAGAAALVVESGFHEPVVEKTHLQLALMVCAAGFVLSRLAILLPLTGSGRRLLRYLLDYLLIIGAVVWYTMDRSQWIFILQLTALYSVLIAVWKTARAGSDALIDGLTQQAVGVAVRRFVIGAAILAISAGAILALPVCWQGAHPFEIDAENYLIRRHVLDCVFTASTALTGTGLSVLDIGYEFSRLGQFVILCLMQLGGLAVLVTGTAIGWRLRQVIGWGASDDDLSHSGVRRLINFTVLAMFVFEVAGAAVLYRMWDPQQDANFAAAVEREGLLPDLVEACPVASGPMQKCPLMRGDPAVEARLFDSVFHAVGAFCNSGLSLQRNGLIAYRDSWRVYGAILPLMLLGGLGGPVLYELFRRLTGRTGRGWCATSCDTRITVLVTVLLVVVGGTLIYGIESTRQYQGRYPREDAVRLRLTETQPTTMQSSAYLERIKQQRLHSMGQADRWRASFYQAAAARSAATRTVRLDELSLSPAGRLVLMAESLIGGGIGGTTGGLRILIFVLLVGAICAHCCSKTVTQEQTLPDSCVLGRRQVLNTAAGIAAAIVGVIGAATLVLAYREAASLEACLFEAVNATCNAGFTTGMTPMLSSEGKIALILAMWLGRVVPLAMLLRYLCASLNSETVIIPPATITQPVVAISRRIGDPPAYVPAKDKP